MVVSNHIDTFSSIAQVSRETIISLNEYEKLLLEANKDLNLIGKSTEKNIWTRHFLDSFQVIDFIDKNDKSLIDLGSGAGFPGLILALAAKDRKIPLKVKLVEKSPKKAKFLNEIIDELNLNVEVLHLNILEQKKKIEIDILTARAFKPLNIILELMHSKVKNWKKIFIFQGKSGDREVLQASKLWDIQYKKRMSVTSKDSFVLEISDLKKK